MEDRSMYNSLRISKEEYDDFAKTEAVFNIDRLKQCEIGRLVVCDAHEVNSTRMYIHRLSRIDDIFMKDGWWDTFTISEKACSDTGYYLCRIKEFRIDRNGYLNMVVIPLHYLGADIDMDSDAWKYFSNRGLLTNYYQSKGYYRTRYNIPALHQLFAEDITRIERHEKERLGDNYICADKKIAEFIMEKFLAGDLTLADIDKALDEKDDLEKLADDLNLNLRRYGISDKNRYTTDYPLLVKKLPMEDQGYYTADCTMRYLKRKNDEYTHLNLGSETELLRRVERVLEYWEEKKVKDKEAKKLARKQRKAKEI